MQLRISLFAAAAIATGAAITPQPAASQASERVLTVFGDDPCPPDTICVRAPENERYRIPKELREPPPSPANESWASRIESFEYVGKTGTMSCSPVGPGGWTGCYQKMLAEARAERRQQRIDPGPQPPQ